MPIYKLIAVSFLAALLAGCPSTQSIPDPNPTDTAGSADTGGMNDNGFGDGEVVDYDGGELGHILYFEFDSSELRPQDTDIVRRHAMQLSRDSGARVRLEGHADERGSREYNIGLGERRSQTVRRMLLIQGATASQISTVSFGEERPAADGSSESAYAQNRRVEIIYVN